MSCKTAVVRLDRIFRRRNMKSRIVMLIHDAIWVEAPANERQQAQKLMEKMMRTAGRPFIELKVDFSE
jgi:DNA polymerase I-like protein with 3'-5' exonuclease and polymerase domains